MTKPAYTAGTVDDSVMDVTVGGALREAAAKWGDAEALVSRHQNVRLSWNELSAAADDAARGLLALGIERGDRIGIWSPTCAEWTILQFASARAGAVLVNVNPAYRPNELLFALNHVGVRMVVTARQFKTSDYHAMLKEVRADVAVARARDRARRRAAPTVRTTGCGPSWSQVAPRVTAEAWPSAKRRSTRTTRSTSSSRAVPPATPRAPRSRITTSSTTARRSPGCSGTPQQIGSASRCRCTTASAWASATWAV